MRQDIRAAVLPYDSGDHLVPAGTRRRAGTYSIAGAAAAERLSSAAAPVCFTTHFL